MPPSPRDANSDAARDPDGSARRADEQSALYRFTDRLFRASSLHDVYDAALEAILTALLCDRASISLFSARGVTEFVAWRGLSDTYRSAVDGQSPWREDDIAAQPVLYEDIARADVPASLVATVMQEGIRALAFSPVLAEGRLAGKFVAYYDAPHRFSRGEIDLALNVARQLSFAIERMRAEHARRRAEEDLRQLSHKLESEVERRTLERDRIWNVSEDLLGVATLDGYFISFNPAWTRTLGWTEGELRARHVDDLRHPDDAAHSHAGRAALARGVPSVRMENRFRHKDGSWRWIAWTMTADKGLIYVSGRDVTAEKAAAAALARAQRQSAHSQKMEALGQLTGGVAHDFNNLLMVISGHAQMLQRRLADADALRALNAIEISTSRGESLTRQLLAFSRPQPLSPTVISPAETVAAIRDVLSTSLTARVELAIDVPTAVWPIRVDRSELELALVNLAVNARDAMPEGGRLSVTAGNLHRGAGGLPPEITGDVVAIRVADTGTGIAEEVLPKVFEPFFTTKGADKGTGLGLSQVYGFARRSGGTVAIESRPGHGTTVTIYLPRSDGAVTRASSDEDLRPARAAGEPVLVVEDNDDVRAIASTLLTELGYQVVAVASAAAALEVLASTPAVKAVFSDVVLPGDTDGLTFARRVRADYPDIPIVLTSGYAKVFDAEPEFPVLRKPYRLASLGRVLREALRGTSGRP